MADQSTCLSPLCGITIEGSEKKCPKCGWAMRSSRNIRNRGWVLLCCGLFLVIFMGWIAWSLLPTLLAPGLDQGGSRFAGTRDQAQMILGLFGLVIAFGAVGTANAIYMIKTGRQSRVFVIVTLAMAAMLIGLAWYMTRALK